MALAPGDVFGRYRIDALLGEGGMGIVLRAHDEKLDRKVALKIVRAPPGDEDARESFERRLVREARAAAALDHPNAVAIFDVGDVDGQAYIAMELVEGRSLKEHVGDPAVPLATRLRWIADVARALDAAHRRGLVHRDIKPSNVMVRDDGVVKVLDFGIARRVTPGALVAGAEEETLTGEGDGLAFTRTQPTSSRPGASLAKSPVATLSAEGRVIGTPLYMAPEQMRGEEVDARADQFSWGVLAYELLAGKKPWGDRLTLATLAEALSNEPRSLAEIVPELPAGVGETVARALSKSRAKRFDSMAAIVARLERPGEPAARSSSWLVLAALGVATVGGGIWIARASTPGGSAPAPAPPSSAASAPPFAIDGAPQVLAARGLCSGMPAFDDHGGIVFAVHDLNDNAIDRLDPMTGNAVELVAGDGENTWPAPGSAARVVFTYAAPGARPDTRSVSIVDGDVRPEKLNGSSAWGAAGFLYFLRADQKAIRRRSFDGSVDSTLFEAPSGASFGPVVASPDGRFVATLLGSGIAGPRNVCTGDVEQGGALDCTSAGVSTGARSAFAPNGRALYFARGEQLVRYDLETHAADAVPSGTRLVSLAIASDGRRMVADDCTWQCDVLRIDRTGPVEVVSNIACSGGVTVGPHGELALADATPDGERLAVTDANGAHLHLLTGEKQRPFAPSFSPDGGSLVFLDRTPKTGGIFVIATDGSRAPVRLSSDPADDGPFFLDADRVLYLQPEKDQPYGRAYVVSVGGGGEPSPLAATPGVAIGAMPDRGSIVLFEQRPEGDRFFERRSDGRLSPIRLDPSPRGGVHVNRFIAVSPSGRYVTWFSGGAGWLLDPRSGALREVPLPPRKQVTSIGADDDGRVFVAYRHYKGKLYDLRGRFE